MKTSYLFFTILLLSVSIHSFCQYNSIKPQGIYSSDFTIDELPRTITYYMPLNYGKCDTYPLLIFLHDEKSSAKNSIKKYGDFIHAKADSADCIVMYPDAVSGHWNSKISTSLKDSVNDAGFISIMLDFFIRQYSCDASRIYLFGIGNGGNMCYRINCDKDGSITAIATANATADTSSFQNCRNKKAVPVLNIKGEADTKAEIGKALYFLFAHRSSTE